MRKIILACLLALTLAGCGTTQFIADEANVAATTAAVQSGAPVPKTTVLSAVNTVCRYSSGIISEVQRLIAENAVTPTAKKSTAIRAVNAALASMRVMCEGGAGPGNIGSLFLRLIDVYQVARQAVASAQAP